MWQTKLYIYIYVCVAWFIHHIYMVYKYRWCIYIHTINMVCIYIYMVYKAIICMLLGMAYPSVSVFLGFEPPTCLGGHITHMEHQPAPKMRTARTPLLRMRALSIGQLQRALFQDAISLIPKNGLTMPKSSSSIVL